MDERDEVESPGATQENPVWNVIRKGETPEQLVLDPETSLEGFLTFCGCLPMFLGLVLMIDILEKGPEKSLVSAIVVAILTGAFFFLLRSNLDDHYILDFAKKEILFHRKFFQSVSKRRVCAFSELHALVIEPEKNSNKQSSWWEYGLAVVTRTGKKIVVISPEKKSYESVVEHGRELADLLKVSFHPGQPEAYLRIKRGPGKPEVEYSTGAASLGLAIVAGVAMLLLMVVVTVIRVW